MKNCFESVSQSLLKALSCIGNPSFQMGTKKCLEFYAHGCLHLSSVVYTSFFFLATGSAFCCDSQVEEAEESCC